MKRREGHLGQCGHIAFGLVLVSVLQCPLFGATKAESPITVTVTSPLRFTVDQGGGVVRSHAVVLKNTGKATLEWAVSSNQAWLRFEPASGSLSPNTTAVVEFIADPAGFAPGIYVASAQIASPNTPAEALEVTMTAQPAFAGDPVGNAERAFPSDSGMVNVKTQYGARGDGVSDDTEAIQQAISATVHHPQTGPRIIYFPAGTYLVSRPLLREGSELALEFFAHAAGRKSCFHNDQAQGQRRNLSKRQRSRWSSGICISERQLDGRRKCCV